MVIDLIIKDIADFKYVEERENGFKSNENLSKPVPIQKTYSEFDPLTVFANFNFLNNETDLNNLKHDHQIENKQLENIVSSENIKKEITIISENETKTINSPILNVVEINSQKPDVEINKPPSEEVFNNIKNDLTMNKQENQSTKMDLINEVFDQKVNDQLSLMENQKIEENFKKNDKEKE